MAGVFQKKMTIKQFNVPKPNDSNAAETSGNNLNGTTQSNFALLKVMA
jgi:hypothetical protein